MYDHEEHRRLSHGPHDTGMVAVVDCLICAVAWNTDRIIQAIQTQGDMTMADLTKLTAAIDTLNTSLANADTREAAEAGADQAIVDQATAAVQAAAAHVDTLDAAPAPAPVPAPAVDPTTGLPVDPNAPPPVA